MNSTIYIQPRTPAQEYYYNVRSKSAPEFAFFDGGNGKLSDFLARYQLMNDLHRRLHPFQFVREGDTVVHAGFDRVYLEKGQSHPLILSALVGPSGRVLAIDADRRNTDAIRKYSEINSVYNLQIVNRAAWKKSAVLEFIFDADWSPMSVASNVLIQHELNGDELFAAGGSRKESVDAEPLDDIVQRHLPGLNISYLSLTVNGAEPEVLEGAKSILQTSPDLRIGLAMSWRNHFSYDIRKEVCLQLADLGFNIVVADAPHDPWLQGPFYFACAVKARPEELVAFGLQETTWSKIESEAAEKQDRVAKAERELHPTAEQAVQNASPPPCDSFFTRIGRQMDRLALHRRFRRRQ